jgi:hypothetical protein
MLAILAAALLAAAPQYDTVFTADGGRVVGTVVEEGAQGIAVQLPDGTTRRLAVGEVTRIEYSDGSVSTPNRPPPPPAYRQRPYAPPPPSYAPPAYRPPPPAPAYAAAPRGGQGPITPLYAAFGIGGAFLNGYAEQGVRMDTIYDTQLDIWMEGGLRLDPHLALGLYVDVGVGEPANAIAQFYPECGISGSDCTATTARVGLLLRHTFSPRALSTPWIAVGTGWEFGNVSADYHDGGSNDELFSYSGWEALRLMAGVDLRSNPVFGVGLYGGVAFGRYSSFESDGFVETDIADERFHTTVQAGVRFTLFP